MKQIKHLIPAMAAVLVTSFLAGCATTTSNSPEQHVAKLAQERWDLVLAGDYVEAYEYYSPGYRSAVDLTDYIVEMKVRRVRWISADMKDISCEENVCKLKWQIGYEVFQPVPGMERWSHFTQMEDDWILLNGKWWYVPPKASG